MIGFFSLECYFLYPSFIERGLRNMSNYCPEWILAVAVGVIVGDALKGSTSILANSQSIQMDCRNIMKQLIKIF